MYSLGDKTLVMLVAPSAMGKSTIVREVCRLDSRFGRVRSFTTREPRPDDEPNQFFYLTPKEVEQKRRADKLVTEVHFPSTDQTYGTVEESYTGEICLLETLAHSVPIYRSLPFKRTLTVAITSPADLWCERFRERYPTRSLAAKKRLEEARQSIEWCLEDTSTIWIINDRPVHTVAQELIDVATSNRIDNGKGSNIARQCLAASHTMWRR